MSTTLSRLTATIIAAGALLVGATAHANRYHVHVHGTTVVPSHTGGVYVHPTPGWTPPRYGVPRPYWYHPTRVWVRGPVFGYRSYYAYPYAYGYGYDYGYAYPTAVVPAPAPAPEAMVVAGPEPREPTIGLGIRGSAIRAGKDHPEAEGLGALLRFRARPVELELEVGWDNYGSDTQRSDTRIATSLYIPIVGHVLQPYVVVGAGMNFAYFGTTGDVLHQGFMNGGGGLALNLSRSFAISGDVRYAVRHFFDSADVVARQPLALSTVPGTTSTSSNDRDEALEFRANAVIYF